MEQSEEMPIVWIVAQSLMNIWEARVKGKIADLYITRADMERMIENNEFVEHAVFSGNMYGTSKKSIQDVLDNGIQALFILVFLLSVQIIKT